MFPDFPIWWCKQNRRRVLDSNFFLLPTHTFFSHFPEIVYNQFNLFVKIQLSDDQWTSDFLQIVTRVEYIYLVISYLFWFLHSTNECHFCSFVWRFEIYSKFEKLWSSYVTIVFTRIYCLTFLSIVFKDNKKRFKEKECCVSCVFECLCYSLTVTVNSLIKIKCKICWLRKKEMYHHWGKERMGLIKMAADLGEFVVWLACQIYLTNLIFVCNFSVFI